jgi:hypothetical protein
MTESAGPILDYASARPMLPLRLADESIITLHQREWGTEIVETLVGKVKAVAAIVFAMSTNFFLITAAVSAYQTSGRAEDAGKFLLVSLGMLTSASLVSVLVVHQTWRRTILEIRPDGLKLIFESPFTKKEYSWPITQVIRALVISAITAKSRVFMPELEIQTLTHPMVKLFAGHAEEILGEIAAQIETVRQSAAAVLPQS